MKKREITIRELRIKKLTAREWLICQYAKEIMLLESDSIKLGAKNNDGKAIGNALRDLECEARMIGDDERQLKNCLWLGQMLSA